MTEVSLGSIEHLDFSIMCGTKWHIRGTGPVYLGEAQPVTALVSAKYPCGNGGSLLVCRVCLDHLYSSNLAIRCGYCSMSHMGPHRRYIINVIHL